MVALGQRNNIRDNTREKHWTKDVDELSNMDRDWFCLVFFDYDDAYDDAFDDDGDKI